MREIIAKGIVVLTLGLLVGLAYLFALLHNRDVPPIARPEPAPGDELPVADLAMPHGEQIALGRAVYARERCASCHSIEGAGSGRYPLDGVGDYWGVEDLIAWTTGTGIAAGELASGTIRRKERYQAIPAEDLEALAVYLSTLTLEDR